MALLFKIANDGKSVYVARTLFASEMEEKDFDKRARRVTVDAFLSKFPKAIAEKLEKNINRVKEIYDMNLTEFGSYLTSNPVSRTTRAHMFVASKWFAYDCGEDEERDDLEEAIEYGKQFYGEEFMKENSQFLNKIHEMHYFSGCKEIKRETYESLQAEKEKLTSIVSLKKEQTKETTNSRK